MSDRETVDFLATVPLLEGRDDADLAALARVVRRRTVREGEFLWRQGEEARELVFMVDGSVSASLHLPGDRTVEVWRAGRGETVGEIALLDGKGHTHERTRDRDRNDARAGPGGVRRAARPPAIRRRSA